MTLAAPADPSAPATAAPLHLMLDGIRCAACVAKVERLLRAQPGVVEARVNLTDRSADLRLTAPATPAALAETLRMAGYAPLRDEIEIAVTGMTCASCVGRVERAVAGLPGVTAAAANLATRSVRVTVLAGGATAVDLAAAVVRAGYAAEPAHPGVAAPDRDAAERQALVRDTTLAAALSLPVVVLEMGGHLVPALHHWIAATVGMQASWVLQSVLALGVLAVPGRRLLTTGLPALWRGAPDMNALVAIGTLSAFVYSLTATYAPGLLPTGARSVYYEAAVVIVTLVLLGRLLEQRARGQAGAAIAGLMRLQPATARVIRGTDLHEVPVAQIVVGDAVQLRPGERVPVDAVVTEGESFVDQSMLTGEPVPVARGPGDSVAAGTVNGTGTLSLRATRVGADATLARIIAMVQTAQAAKLPVQAVVDRITQWFVPAVMAAAAAAVVVWLIFGPGLAEALVAGVSVLIIACPCAMGLAVPVSIVVGTGRAAQLGVLFRRGEALQQLQGARCVAFDKTGTLTLGRPVLTDLEVAEGFAADDVLALVAAVEAGSEHPVAAAIRTEAGRRGVAVPAATGFRALPGYGAQAMVGGQAVLVGTDRLMAREGIDTGALAEGAARLAALGRTPFHAAVDGRIAALIAVADPVRPGAAEAIAALRAQGVQVAMLSGDAPATAGAIAATLGIDTVHAGLLPGEKVAAVRALDGPVAFVGDGINDAPALAAADVGIAMGTGTDVAMDAGAVVLMSGDPRGVVTAIGISRRTMANIRQNLIWAFGYNIVLIPVAAGVLVPFGGPQLSPMLAAGAMAGSSLFVLGNALRLRWASGAGA